MLENDGVGARSGTSSVRGSARSQKYWKERRSTSPRSAASATLAGGSWGTDVPVHAPHLRDSGRARRSGTILPVKRSSSPWQSNDQKLIFSPPCSPRGKVTTQDWVPEVGFPPGPMRLSRQPSLGPL